MEGIKKIKSFFGIIIPFLAIFLMSQNTFADAAYISDFGVTASDWSNNQCSNTAYTENHSYNSNFYGCSVQVIVPVSNELTAGGNYIIYSGKLNLVKKINNDRSNTFRSDTLQLGVRNFYFGNTLINITQEPTMSYFITDWSSNGNNYQTLTIVWSIMAHGNIKNTTGRIRISFYNQEAYTLFDNVGYLNNSSPYYFENTGESLSVYYSDDGTEASNMLISQNSQLISQNQIIINNQTQNTQDIIDNQNQNSQDVIDNQNQNTEDIIKSNQNCYQSPNLLESINWTTSNVTKTESDGVVHLTANAGTLARAVFPLSGLEQGEKYVLSAYIKGVSVDDPYTYVRIRSGSASGDWQSNAFLIPASNDFHRLSLPFTASTTSPYSWFYLSASTETDTDIDIYVKDIQLEKGTVATQYIPYGEESCKNINQEYYDEQRQADQNISNQSTSDISGAENAQTTSLINVISGFIGAFSNINSTNCSVTLQFPNFAGGTRVVDICSGKEKAPRIIEIGSSLLLICVFVPLAYIVIRMIYNEIRSWTNG